MKSTWSLVGLIALALGWIAAAVLLILYFTGVTQSTVVFVIGGLLFLLTGIIPSWKFAGPVVWSFLDDIIIGDSGYIAWMKIGIFLATAVVATLFGCFMLFAYIWKIYCWIAA